MTQSQRRNTKTPKGAGLYWASFDDGEKVLEVVPLRVYFYDGTSSFDDGALVDFIDGSGRSFSMKSIEDEIVQPGRAVVRASRSWLFDDSVRVTWLGEMKPPRSAPKPGDDSRAADFS